MKRILIDLDGTICNEGYLQVLNQYFNTNYTYDEIDAYYVESMLTEEQLKEYLHYFYEKENVYNYVTIFPDAIEVIEKLSKQYEVYICSAYVDKRVPYESGIVSTLKHRWLMENLPFLDPRKFIFTGSKEMILCDIRIDDKFSNLKGCGELKLLIDSYHNQDYTEEQIQQLGITRVSNWKEIEQILL